MDTKIAIDNADLESHAKNLRSQTLKVLLAGWIRWLVRVGYQCWRLLSPRTTGRINFWPLP